MKTGVIVCSNAALDYIPHNEYIPVFRSVVIFNENEKYDDYTEIKAEDFYHRLATDKTSFPHTAFVSPGKMVEIFDEMKEKGYERVLCILISEKLSSLAKTVRMVADDYEGLDIVVYDSRTIAYPQALMALTAAKMFNENKSLDEVLKRLDFIRDHNHLIFCVETLEYLIKNGRLSKVAGGVANLLQIKPLLGLDKMGAIETLAKIRTTKKAREAMIDLFLKEVKDKDVTPCIIHANAKEEVIKEIKDKVLAIHPEYQDINVYPLTPVVGAHAGPGTISLGYIENYHE